MTFLKIGAYSRYKKTWALNVVLFKVWVASFARHGKLLPSVELLSLKEICPEKINLFKVGTVA